MLHRPKWHKGISFVMLRLLCLVYHDSGYRPRVENSWNRFKTLSKLRCVVVLHFDHLVCFYVYATDILLACLRLANLIVIELFTWLSTRVPAWCRFLGFLFHSHLSHVMTIPTKWHVRPAKTQISLGIRPVWSESSLSTCKKLGSLATHWAHSEDWSDWADVQADLGLRWAHSHFVRLCHVVLIWWCGYGWDFDFDCDSSWSLPIHVYCPSCPSSLYSELELKLWAKPELNVRLDLKHRRVSANPTDRPWQVQVVNTFLCWPCHFYCNFEE